jgi:putative ABC transport system permease protein
MFLSNLKLALRNMRRRPGMAFIMLFGLITSICAATLLILFIRFEWSYDNFHLNADNIVRVNEERLQNGARQYLSATTYPSVAPQIKAASEDVLHATRMIKATGMISIARAVEDSSSLLSQEVSKNGVAKVFTLKGFDKAKRVSIAGTFNGWKPDSILLASNGKQGGEHEWSISLTFPKPIQHEYKFIVENEWMTDPANPLRQTDTNGNTNSIARIGLPETKLVFQDAQFFEDKIFYADADFLQMFTFPMLLGTSNEALSEPNSVVLTEKIAKKYFGTQNPLGQTLSFKRDALWKVTGVVKEPPANSRIQFSMLVSVATMEAQNKNLNQNWDWYSFYTYLHLKPNTDRTRLASMIGSLCEKSTGDNLRRTNAKEIFTLQPFRALTTTSNLESTPEASSQAVFALSLIAILILAVAYINYINLATARFTERLKDMGIRKVLGASRTEFIKQFFAEPLVLNALSLVIALGFVEIFLKPFADFTERPLHLLSGNLLWDFGTWGFVVGLVVLGTVLSAVYPALSFMTFTPSNALQGRIHERLSKFSFRTALILVQFVVAVVLIVGTLVMNRQINFLLTRDLGFKSAQTLVVRAGDIQGSNEMYNASFDAFKQEILKVPGVRTITASTDIPGMAVPTYGGQIRRTDDPDETHTYSYGVIGVDYDYLQNYGMKFIAGKNFSREYGLQNQAAVLNETALGLLGYRSAQEAIGKTIVLPWVKSATIVGVVKDFHQESLHQSIKPLIFTIFPGHGAYSISLESGLQGAAVKEALKRIEAAYNRTYPMSPFEAKFLDDLYNLQYKQDRQFSSILGTMTLLMISIACFGLFGLAIFTVEQRTKEIGIRKVLGASVANIVMLLSSDFLKIVALGVVIAIPLGYWISGRWLQDFAYKVTPEWWLFAVSGILALFIAFMTVVGQSWRAAQANPVKSLRSE